MDAILAIDLGSTRFKAAVFTAGLERVGEGACELRYTYGDGGAVELEAEVVEDAVRGAVTAALAGTPGGVLRAVAVTSQAQTFSVTDAAYRPLVPFVSWLDRRGGAACAALQREGTLAEIACHATFPALDRALQLCQLRRLHDEAPGLPPAGARVLTLPAWLTARLTGAPVTDCNLAAMSGLYSMQQGGWWPAALRAAGVTEAQLPRLCAVGATAGITTAAAAALGVPAGLPVVAAGNDQTAGAFGARVHEQDALLITLGTCQVVYRVPAPAPRPDRTTAAGPYPGGGWYAMAADTCGGNLVNWAKTVLAGCARDEDFFAAAAGSPPGCRGLRFEMAPGADNNAWRGLAPVHTPGDCARALLEALVRRLRDLVAGLADPCPATILLAGGGSRQPLWAALTAEALGRPVVRTEADPLAGAARLAQAAWR